MARKAGVMTFLKRAAPFVGLLCAILTFAESTKQSSTPNVSGAQTPSTLSVDVDLVLLNATVTDPANRYITGLKQEHFRLWEDKIQQEIRYFSAEEIPLSVGIIFDVSGSMEDKLTPARLAANSFLRTGNRGDEYFLVEFSDSPRVVHDFTTDVAKLETSLLLTRAKGRTSLYDALYLGLEKVNRGSNFRKALLLITDGEDNHSRYSFSDVREFAREHDVLIYPIGIVGHVAQALGYSGRAVLENLATLTGGAAFFPSSVDALDSICAQIGVDLRNQYVLGYRSMNSSKDGSWRKIRVKIDSPKGMPPLSVRAKTGYYAPTIAKSAN
jgi:Ca-activated chloride channel family protein